MRAKNIALLIVTWTVILGIVFLVVYVREHSQLQENRVQINNLNLKLKLGHLRNLAGALYLQTTERNYGLAAQTSSTFFDQLRGFSEQASDPGLKQVLTDLLNSRDQITAGLAKGDPAVLSKVADVFQKMLSIDTP